MIYSFHGFVGRNRPAFTLVEMVSVISVLAVLLVVGIRMLTGTGAQARKAGGDTLAAMIDQARIAAISSRAYVVLAVAEPGDLSVNDGRCRLGMFKVEVWPDSTDSAIEGVLINRWRVLESGVVLLDGDVEGLVNPLAAPEIVIECSKNHPRVVKLHAIAFNSRGGLHYPVGSSPVVLRIAEGVYQNGVAPSVPRSGSRGEPENRIKIGRVIARPIRIDR